MGIKKIEKIYTLFDALKNCFLFHICLIFGSLAGGIILGIGPSLLSASEIIKKDYHPFAIREGLIKQFALSWKRNFKAGNQLFLPLFLLTIFFYIDIKIIAETPFAQQTWILIALVIVQGLLWLMFSCLFPLYAFYNMSIKEGYKKCTSYLLYNPILAISIILWGLLIKGLATFIPATILFLIFGIWIQGNSILFYRSFEHNEKLIMDKPRLN